MAAICAAIPSLCEAIWSSLWPNWSIWAFCVSRRATKRRFCPSICSATSGRVGARSVSSVGNVNLVRSSRSASSRALRAIASNNWPSTIAKLALIWAPSSRISRSPDLTVCASCTAISATTPPSGCCTTWRFCSTCTTPLATIAPEMVVSIPQPPKKAIKRATVAIPVQIGWRADQVATLGAGGRAKARFDRAVSATLVKAVAEALAGTEAVSPCGLAGVWL